MPVRSLADGIATETELGSGERGFEGDAEPLSVVDIDTLAAQTRFVLSDHYAHRHTHDHAWCRRSRSRRTWNIKSEIAGTCSTVSPARGGPKSGMTLPSVIVDIVTAWPTETRWIGVGWHDPVA